MDFALTEEQLELQAMVREFVERKSFLTRMKWIKQCLPSGNHQKGWRHGAAEPGCPGRIWRTGP